MWSLILGLVLSVARYFDDANDKQILDFLLHKSNYDNRIKPLADGTHFGGRHSDQSQMVHILGVGTLISLRWCTV